MSHRSGDGFRGGERLFLHFEKRDRRKAPCHTRKMQKMEHPSEESNHTRKGGKRRGFCLKKNVFLREADEKGPIMPKTGFAWNRGAKGGGKGGAFLGKKVVANSKYKKGRGLGICSGRGRTQLPAHV